MSKRYDSYLARLAGLDGLLGVCVLEVATGAVQARRGEDEEVLGRLVAGAAVLRAQQQAAEVLGVGAVVEDMVISQASEYHVLRLIGAAPGLCCAVALARRGSNLAMARLTLVEAEAALVE